MRRKVIVLTMLLMFLFNITAVGAFADEEVTTETIYGEDGQAIAEVEIATVEAGTTPDENFYEVKRILEKVQLFLAFSDDQKATLLADFAEKRLAEAEAMEEEGELDLVKEMLEDYVETLVNAQEKAEESIADGVALEEVISKIEKLLNDNDELINKIKEQVPELESNIKELQENLAVVKIASELIEELDDITEIVEDDQEAIENDEDADTEDEATEEQIIDLDELEDLSDKEVITKLRDMGYGYGEISIVFAFAKKADVSIKEVVEIREAGAGWGNVAKELNIHKRDIAKEIGKMIVKNKEFLVDENQEEEVNIEEQGDDLEEEDINDGIDEDAENVNEDVDVDNEEDENQDENLDIENTDDDIEGNNLVKEIIKEELKNKKEMTKKELEIKKETLKKEREIKKEALKKELEAKKQMVKEKQGNKKNK